MNGNEPGGPIQWRMHIPASPEKVFKALDSDQGRAAFWSESAVEGKDGIIFRFINGQTYTARILQRRPPDLLEIRYFGSPARFDLKGDGTGGTDLTLTHTGVPSDDWIEVHAGWLNVLFPLKAWVVHGIDLRNHDSERTWEQGYADQ